VHELDCITSPSVLFEMGSDHKGINTVTTSFPLTKLILPSSAWLSLCVSCSLQNERYDTRLTTENSLIIVF